jgi:flavin-dependent dehydrogenase
MTDCDALIIGAGLAGLVTARQLARSGHRVALVDIKADVDARVHTTGIFVRRTLQDFALPEDCLGAPISRVSIHSPAGRTFALESAAPEFRLGRMGLLYSRLLSDALHAGATFLPRTRYVGSAACDGGSAVWLERNGRRWRLRTRWLVGADGARSHVARDLGLDRNTHWLIGVEDVFEGAMPDAAPALHCFIDPRIAPGYIAWIAHDGVCTHVGLAGDANRFDPGAALVTFGQRVRRAFDLTHARRMERRGGWIPVNGILRRIACNRGLVVGDAAGAVSPLTAGGLDACVRLGHVAAHVLADALDGAGAAAFASYNGDRYQTRFATRRFMRAAISKVQQPALAEAAVLALSVPPFRWLARHVFFGRGSFPDIDPEATGTYARTRTFTWT